LAGIGERKQVAHTRFLRTRGLPKPLIKIPAALAASDVDEQSVEHRPLLFIFVETQVEKLS
jgi:hypothetical protein